MEGNYLLISDLDGTLLGDDKAMFAQGFRGIVVANAHEELKRIQAPTIYHAKGAFAAGVQEGMNFWLDAVTY